MGEKREREGGREVREGWSGIRAAHEEGREEREVLYVRPRCAYIRAGGFARAGMAPDSKSTATICVAGGRGHQLHACRYSTSACRISLAFAASMPQRSCVFRVEAHACAEIATREQLRVAKNQYCTVRTSLLSLEQRRLVRPRTTLPERRCARQRTEEARHPAGVVERAITCHAVGADLNSKLI